MRTADCGLLEGPDGWFWQFWLIVMNAEEFKKRTKTFALRVIHLVESLPASRASNVIGRQLLRSGTSVGANYRAACRGRSRPEFISKLGIVEEECDESLFWMELLVENNYVKASLLRDLMKESDEILAIVVSSAKTARTTNRS